MKRSLTKKSRIDLSRRMARMCEAPGGWQATTLNVDMSAEEKRRILIEQCEQATADRDDPDEVYAALLGLAAAAMGYAQGIARRADRDRKRTNRARRRANRDRKRAQRRAGRPVETVETAVT